MLHHLLPQFVPHPVSIPAVRGQQPLHPVWGSVASMFGQLPTILALHRPQQSLTAGQGSLPRLATAKAARDALVQRLEPRRPLQHILLLQSGWTHNQPLPSHQQSWTQPITQSAAVILGLRSEGWCWTGVGNVGRMGSISAWPTRRLCPRLPAAEVEWTSRQLYSQLSLSL